MAVLTAQQRKNMRSSEFGLPKSKGFPMNDKTHDREAISGAARSYNAGNISKSTEERLQAEARRKLSGATGQNTEPVQREQVRGGQGSPMRRKRMQPEASMEQDGGTPKKSGSPMRFRGGR